MKDRAKVIDGIKLVITTAAGLGITFLCSALAGNLAGSSNAGALKKACMALGGTVIAGMIANQAEKYINTEVDNAVDRTDELLKVIKDAKETGKA